jgi:ABC-type ATPase involved in cell division
VGEQQRIRVARVFINQPSATIAAEPTGNLDGVNAMLVSGL